MALVTLATAATFRAVSDTTNTARVIRRATVAIQNIAIGTLDIMQAAYFRDANCLREGVKCYGNAALASVDTVVYGIAVIIPIIPIGFTWATFRRQQ